jgi:protein-tyrosine phosphatase
MAGDRAGARNLEQLVDRTLRWDGLYNVRDLGGHPTPQGPTRFGAVVRSEDLALISETGRAALHEYGIQTIVDLRSPREVGQEIHPLRSLPGYRNLPLLDHEAMEDVDAIADVADAYRYMVDRRATQIAEILRTMGASPAPQLVHCKAGKDRTGVVVALLLANAGADRDSIVADYALSDDALTPLYEIWARAAGEDAGEARERMRRYPSRPQAMQALFEHLDTRYGGCRPFLLSSGLREPELDSLARLLAP